MNDQSAFITRATTAYARLITKHPARVLAVLLEELEVRTWK